MSAGLYSLSVIAEFLGQRPDEMEDRIQLDGMPAIAIPARTKPIKKVALLAFHSWLAERSANQALTVEQLEKELERCEEAVLRRNQIKAAKMKARTEQPLIREEAA